jgi:hypothetical protein
MDRPPRPSKIVSRDFWGMLAGQRRGRIPLSSAISRQKSALGEQKENMIDSNW